MTRNATDTDKLSIDTIRLHGMRNFGMSAPIAVEAEHFGFTVAHVVEAA
jgi:transketolase